MELKSGTRVRVVNQPDPPFEGTLMGPAAGKVLREGGGETFLADWRVRREDGKVVVVPEAALQPPE